MARLLHIIANCTDRKRAPVPADLRLRSLPPGNVATRTQHWSQRLHNRKSQTFEAVDLYAGDHWAIVRALPEIARAAGFDPLLWIASAGYGLVPTTARLQPYSATFAPGHPDSVCTGGDNRNRTSDLRSWWHELAKFPGPASNAPRSIKDLTAQSPAASVLVVASPDYVSAMTDDLVAALGHLNDRERLAIISAPTARTSEPLHPHVVPSVARLQPELGGSRTSLHARLARRILEDTLDGTLRISELRVRWEDKIRKSPELTKYCRQSMSDAQIREFLCEERAKNPQGSHTQLLRKLRDSGRACEQARFRALFHNLTEDDYAS